MERTTTELTQEYIRDHPDIKNCLKKGLINYSSLSRLIARELHVEKTSSLEAILIAARRFRERLREEVVSEKKIREILATSELEIKNKMGVVVLRKNIDATLLEPLQKQMMIEGSTFFVLEGSDNYTIIAPARFAQLIEQRYRASIIKSHLDLVLINLKSPKTIENTPGVVAFLTGLLSENGVNIIEFLSCWTDTIFIISAADLPKVITVLKF